MLTNMFSVVVLFTHPILFGFGFNWVDLSNNVFRDQHTGELYCRFQFFQHLALAPSVQLLIDPALNTSEDQI